jgi:hypothetical protein
VKSEKRKRQYEHIKESAQKRGRSTKRAKEIAARTVNKQRREAGQTRTTSGGGKKTGGRKKTTGRATGGRKRTTARTGTRRSGGGKKR